MPLEVTVKMKKIGDTWTPQPITISEEPFKISVLSANQPDALQCSKGVPSKESYPCFRITNAGYFDWEWERLHWGGETWGGSWTDEIKLPSQGSIEVRYNSNWADIMDNTIGLDDEEGMWIFLTKIP
jgi:hypothetical protein